MVIIIYLFPLRAWMYVPCTLSLISPQNNKRDIRKTNYCLKEDFISSSNWCKELPTYSLSFLKKSKSDLRVLDKDIQQFVHFVPLLHLTLFTDSLVHAMQTNKSLPLGEGLFVLLGYCCILLYFLLFDYGMVLYCINEEK